MPTEHSPADKSEDYPWTEKMRERIGEDPARFLDVEIVDPSSPGESPLKLAKARIDGIDSLEVVNAWLAIERQLDRGPRQRVEAWLRNRRQTLEEIGDREDRLDGAPRADPPSTESALVFLDEDGEERERNSFTSRVSRRSEHIATDGGEST